MDLLSQTKPSKPLSPRIDTNPCEPCVRFSLRWQSDRGGGGAWGAALLVLLKGPISLTAFSGCVTGSASVGMRPPPRAALGRSPPSPGLPCSPSFCSARHPTRPLFPLLPSLSCSDAGQGNSECRTACHVARRSRRLFLLSSPHKRLFCFPPKIARLASTSSPPYPPPPLWGNSARWPPAGNPLAAPPTPVRLPAGCRPPQTIRRPNLMGKMTAEVAAAEVINRLMFWTFTSVLVVKRWAAETILAVESRVFRCCARFMQISN